jgi:hypothetical protein
VTDLVQRTGEMDRLARLGMWLAALESGKEDANTKGASAALRLYFTEQMALPPTAVADLTVINGRLHVGAQLLRALAARRGYAVKRTEYTTEACTAVLVDGDGVVVGETRFTIEEARRANLIRPNSGWQKYPERMLWARASSWVIRDFAPEVSLGMLEESEAADFETVAVREEDLGPVEQGRPAVTNGVRLMTDKQRARVFAMMEDAGIDVSDAAREARLAFVSKVVGREVGSTSSLTVREAGLLIDQLELLIPAPEPAPPEDDGERELHDQLAETVRARLDAIVTERLAEGTLTPTWLWGQVSLFRHVGVDELAAALAGRDEHGKLDWSRLYAGISNAEATDLLAAVMAAGPVSGDDDDIPF